MNLQRCGEEPLGGKGFSFLFGYPKQTVWCTVNFLDGGCYSRGGFSQCIANT